VCLTEQRRKRPEPFLLFLWKRHCDQRWFRRDERFLNLKWGARRKKLGKAVFKAYLRPLREIDWVVYAKQPFAGPRQVLLCRATPTASRSPIAGWCPPARTASPSSTRTTGSRGLAGIRR
jgi:hypothetical protein